MNATLEVPDKVMLCDYCKDTPAIMYFYGSCKAACGNIQCERHGKEDAAKHEMERRKH